MAHLASAKKTMARSQEKETMRYVEILQPRLKLQSKCYLLKDDFIPRLCEVIYKYYIKYQSTFVAFFFKQNKL